MEADQVARGGPHISRLAFVDDLIFFLEANMEQAKLTQNILLNFFLGSSQKASQEKTRVIFSNNVPRGLKVDFYDELGFQMTEDLRKHLDVPIFHKKVGLKIGTSRYFLRYLWLNP